MTVFGALMRAGKTIALVAENVTDIEALPSGSKIHFVDGSEVDVDDDLAECVKRLEQTTKAPDTPP